MIFLFFTPVLYLRMATSNNSSHVIRLFSNASTELFDNTLSCFSNRLAKPLILSNQKEWEIAVKSLYIPHLIHQDHLHITRNDLFHFDNNFDEKIFHVKPKWLMEDFTDFLAVLNPNTSDIYTDYYFKDYLKNDTHYSGLSFMKAHSSEFAPQKIASQPEVKFHFDLNKFLYKNERMSDIISSLSSDFQKSSFDNFEVKYYKGLGYTGIQILNNFLIQFLTKFQTSLGIFSQLSLETIPSSYRTFVKKLDAFCLRITKAFVENLRNSLSKIKEVSKYNQNSDILFIYCDACELSYVGNKLAKTLAVVVPSASIDSEKNLFNFPSPVFMRLESLTLTEIKILICNQYGELAHFSSSITPTFIELIIRSAMRNE